MAIYFYISPTEDRNETLSEQCSVLLVSFSTVSISGTFTLPFYATLYFYITTFQREILFFSLHYTYLTAAVTLQFKNLLKKKQQHLFDLITLD